MSLPERRDTGTEKLLVDVADGVARVTFNNPAKRNALSVEMRSVLPKVFESLQADAEVRVIVLTGAGTEAFISGADISEFGERRTSPEARAEYDRGQSDFGRAWLAVTKPVIAEIRGFCMGGGLLVALSADVRIASDDAQFGIPAARLGLGYGYGGVETLANVVGGAWAAEILFSARRLTAAEALGAGLVSRVVPSESLTGEVTALAHAIRDNAPLTVAACKAALREWRREPAKRELGRVAVQTSYPHIQSGRLRALAVTSPSRMKQFSELPTVAETTGLKDYDAAVMFATWAPAKTPRDVLNRLHSDTVKALQSPEFRSRLEREGASDPIGNTPDQMAATIRSDMEKLGKLVKAANIQLQ